MSPIGHNVTDTACAAMYGAVIAVDLILAAFAERCSLDVILAVYHEDGPAYCGLFRYPEGCGTGEDALYDIRYRILPQGTDWQMVYSDFAYRQGKTDGNALKVIIE